MSSTYAETADPHELSVVIPRDDGPAGDLPPASPEGRPWSRRSWVVASVVAVVAALATAVAFPGDITWVNDEPAVMARASQANAAGVLAEYGLMGNFGVTYGPTATQIYQGLLVVSRGDAVVLAGLRAGLSAGLTALALVWLGRSLRLPPWFAAAVALAPLLWGYHRILWDASFAIPFGTMALAAYAGFLRTGSRWPLGLATFCALVVPFTHPMSALFAGPLAVHALARNWRAAARHWWVVLIAVAAVYGLNHAYLDRLAGELTDPRLGALGDRAYPGSSPGLDRVASAAAPLLSGRLLAAHRYGDELFRWAGVGRVALVAQVGAYAIYPLIWGGLGVAAWRLVTRRRRHAAAVAAGSAPEPLRRWGDFNRISADAARDALANVALAVAVVQAVVFGIKRVPPDPQYFFGTVAAYVLLAWVAIDALGRYRVALVPAASDAPPASRRRPSVSAGSLATAVYGLSAAAVTLATIWHVHAGPAWAGEPAPHNPNAPTLRMTVDVARQLNRYADDAIWTDVPFYQEFPQALRGARCLAPADPSALPPARQGRLLLRWSAAPAGGGPPRLEVVELGPPLLRGRVFGQELAVPPFDLPPGAGRIEVSPLPGRCWK